VDVQKVEFGFPDENETNHSIHFRQEENVANLLLKLPPQIKVEMENKSSHVSPKNFRHVADG
jgi:hypothetical protein